MKVMGENFGIKLDDFISEQLKDTEFKKEYDSLEVEYQLITMLLEAREQRKITQSDLSKVTGIAQGDISKIEKGSANPSLKTLKRLADGLGMNLKIEFVNK